MSGKTTMKKRAKTASTVAVPSFLGRPDVILPPLFVILTCLKILLIPSYRSTDFDVHRNWLAVTKQTPISEWYWNDVNGQTVHTLDYPPAFAFFEYLLANNPITDMIFPRGDDRCLQLLPDWNNHPSPKCVVFQRATVILGDVVFWAGAYFACRAYHYGKPLPFAMTSFLLLVLNPALLWLDHIHFQYNGMMIGIFLASLGCLMMGNNVAILPPEHLYTVKQPILYDVYHLGGAALFALLLNFKHLYLPLAPLYFCYLLERYCLTYRIPQGKTRKQFLPLKFLQLGLVTGTVLVLPWIPFVKANNPGQQVVQILKRLFPFGRGLVHDYWAGNIWALYTFANRMFLALNRRLVPMLAVRFPEFAMQLQTMYLPEPSPQVCAILLFLSIIPGLQMSSLLLTNQKLVESVVYVSFCAFMLAYHVHEKAILTALIPLTLLVEPLPRRQYHNLLFWYTSLWALLGLFPLLFRPIELTVKLSSYIGYMGLTSYLLRTPPQWMEEVQDSAIAMGCAVVGLLEMVPIQGKWEFFPLMATSIVCAVGLVGCWAVTFMLLVRL